MPFSNNIKRLESYYPEVSVLNLHLTLRSSLFLILKTEQECYIGIQVLTTQLHLHYDQRNILYRFLCTNPRETILSNDVLR